MFETVPLVLTLTLVAVVVWFAAGPGRSVFVVKVIDGEPRTTRGTVTAGFLAAVREACERHGVRSGTVRGMPKGRRISLRFSAFPPAGQQQLRNWWATSGWNLRPDRR